MLNRLLSPPRASAFLFGPRGTGKSTWLKAQGPKGISYDLLDAQKSLRLGKEPGLLYRELVGKKPGSWIILDEIQKVPSLLDDVHRLMEEKHFRFLMSGSSARKLRRGAANLLGGRAIPLSLFPLVSRELGHRFDVERALRFGTLPLSWHSEDPATFLRGYTQTYLQEEVKSEALTRNLGGFARFLEVAARQNGQVTNVSNISRDALVARQTVQGFFEVLIDTLMGFWLPAWKLKRATKQATHPKFYFFDPGVARALSERAAYPVQPEEKGFLVETLLLSELRAYLSYHRLHYPLSFWRSHDGVEVDVLFETQRGYLALEIKSASRWEDRYGQGLRRIREELGSRVKCLGVFLGDRDRVSSHGDVWTVPHFLTRLWDGEIFE
ncbi:MAG: ATP-binding protein [Elusimicrobia bacterium]|jgi:predicted AAA+ superfamily ATPase|nr:ATP-binding protein [Elusimicrobiota bacterium]